MGDTKPLGSEKLNNDEKFKRILELTYYNSSNKNTKSTKSELVKESTSGTLYGIVKEKDGYYVKKGLNESSLDYIGGMFMKNKNRFSSYAEALKRLELLKGQEQINEATKYVLKQKPKQNEAPVSSEPPIEDLPPAPGGEEMPSEPSGEEPTLPPMPGGEEPTEPSMDSEMEPSSDEMGEKRSDYMAEIQKYAGKLGQELRDQKDRMESDDIKYVLNMVISAVDLDKLELEDLEEIGEKFEREEEEPNMGDEEPSYEEEPSMKDQPNADDEKESEFNEYDDPLKKLESFESWNVDEMDKDEIVELDLDEIKTNVNKSVSDILNKYFSKM